MRPGRPGRRRPRGGGRLGRGGGGLRADGGRPAGWSGVFYALFSLSPPPPRHAAAPGGGFSPYCTPPRLACGPPPPFLPPSTFLRRVGAQPQPRPRAVQEQLATLFFLLLRVCLTPHARGDNAPLCTGCVWCRLAMAAGAFVGWRSVPPPPHVRCRRRHHRPPPPPPQSLPQPRHWQDCRSCCRRRYCRRRQPMTRPPSHPLSISLPRGESVQYAPRVLRVHCAHAPAGGDDRGYCRGAPLLPREAQDDGGKKKKQDRNTSSSSPSLSCDDSWRVYDTSFPPAPSCLFVSALG